VISRTELLILALLVFGTLAWSAVDPVSRNLWWLHVSPFLVALPVLLVSWWKFPLTPLVYRLIGLLAIVLFVGGHYTYARVPAGELVREWFGLARNHYDRFAYAIEGVVPAIIAREIMLRRTALRPDGWMAFLVCAVALGLSAVYELAVWWYAIYQGNASAESLGTWADPLDTMWDMSMALAGAVLAQVFVARTHNRQLTKLFVEAAGRGFTLDAKGGRRSRVVPAVPPASLAPPPNA
jgi:putative membrane protein